MPEKNNFVVCFKEVNSEYILQDNEYVVNVEFDPSLFEKNYDPSTQSFSINTEVKEELAVNWRNSELERTDSLMQLSDYPYKDQLVEYRQTLRDWPDTSDFPNVKPTSPY